MPTAAQTLADDIFFQSDGHRGKDPAA